MANNTQDLSLESIVATAITLPGVKVSRNAFLTECFKNEDVNIHDLIDNGPIDSGCSREMLSRLANNLIVKRTSQSSIASFAAGLPGGLAMGVAVPADVMQYFGVALRLAQELSYLYGAQDLWNNGEVDTNLVNGQLILYCGVMFGVSGAANGVRLLSAQLAKTAAKKIPQKALTKTIWYPVVKQVGKAVGVKVTKSTVANGISKVIPVVGGVVSGGITFASMMPMGKRLAVTLDDANFDYTEDEINEDIAVVKAMSREDVPAESEKTAFLKGGMEGVQKGLKDIGTSASGLFSKVQKRATKVKPLKKNVQEDDIFQKIEKLAKLHDMGALTQEEFEEKKAELLEKI